MYYLWFSIVNEFKKKELQINSLKSNEILIQRKSGSKCTTHRILTLCKAKIKFELQ